MQQDNIPSFDRADYLNHPSAALDPIAGYREFGSAIEQERDHAAYVRSILFGIAAAIAGCALYAGVEMATGWTIGYVALAVGYMVGKAMKAGSGGRGGRRYQIAACLLTYAAVAMAAIPVAIHQNANQPAPRSGSSSADAGGSDTPGTERAATSSAPTRPAGGLLAAVGTLVGIGLASPFLELSSGVGGIIGLFILFIGIRAAWQLTAGTEAGIPTPGRTILG